MKPKKKNEITIRSSAAEYLTFAAAVGDSPGSVEMRYQDEVSLWFLNRAKKQPGKSLFIDARNMGTMVSRRLREMTDEDIGKIAAAFEAFENGVLKDEAGFCAAVTTEEIAKQDHILTPGRYVGLAEQEDDGEPFDEKMARLTGKLSEMFKRSHELEGEIRKRLGVIGFEI